MTQGVEQLRLVDSDPVTTQGVKQVVFVDDAGDPVDIGGGDISVAWNDVTGRPDEFPPEDHSHSLDSLSADVEGVEGSTLQEVLEEFASRLQEVESDGGDD